MPARERTTDSGAEWRSIGGGIESSSYHVNGHFAHFHVSELLAEVLHALLLLGDLLGEHRPQVRAGTSARVGRGRPDFLKRDK